MDVTYLKIDGRWNYLYRAIDKSGKLIDVYLSDVRDEQAAKKFFCNCKETTGITPDQITTDKEKAFPAAIANSLGKKVKHRTSKYKNNIMEQNHCGIKSPYGAMKCFKDIWCAMFFCTAFEEAREFFALRNYTTAQSRGGFVSKFQGFINIFAKIA